jgi:predicted nucleic acid-binding protein
MTTFVVDASVAVKWLVTEHLSEAAVRLLNTRHALIAPELLFVEAGNALWAMSQRGDFSHRDLEQALDTLLLAPVTVPASLSELLPAAIRLASDVAHPVYDCCYLALAVRNRAPVVTADERFLAAVRKHRHLTDMMVSLGEVAA